MFLAFGTASKTVPTLQSLPIFFTVKLPSFTFGTPFHACLATSGDLLSILRYHQFSIRMFGVWCPNHNGNLEDARKSRPIYKKKTSASTSRTFQETRNPQPCSYSASYSLCFLPSRLGPNPSVLQYM